MLDFEPPSLRRKFPFLGKLETRSTTGCWVFSSSPTVSTTQSLGWAIARIVAFIELECGLCLACRVSSRISVKQGGLFARPVSASENSVPRSGGDWFDDCVLGSEYGGKRPVSAIRD